MPEEQQRQLALTVEIITAYVSENKISPDELIRLIGTVYNSLSVPTASGVKEQIPAVPIKRSVFPDYIICLEDGKKLKMLKRHLQASYGMTPEEYRRKWGLPSHYPMVAPNYTVRRSELAREIGLGRDIMSTATKSGDEGVTDPALPDKPQERRRGRKKAVH
ncbi:Putative mucR family transcriptional regulatory protein [Gluconacetobacter sp. SXCC-1]|uniref:MucR family transcriptional regulator n=1 Tax=Novacetimonas cocois TaxID=1747507 RepID=A0A365YUG0_9PROT|nr:MucR family transcriptional regulator [Novacetimonas cocois]EGG78678.1 Putative mucR family transcriptional regulatory protein [Gluconacetobacter sp. SXCC-1]MBE7618488.1 MucR family transcriptional regulator [Komagataeibacter sp. FXV2]RBM06510.1 MucR family transcriptional regulator [Novacetimonas cocois]